MKLVSLNTWGGKVFEPLMDFVKTESKDTDIFCLQEIFDTSTDKKTEFEYRVNLLEELQSILPDFTAFYTPFQEGQVFRNPVDFPISWGVAIFIRKNISVEETGDFFVYRTRNSMVNNDSATMPRTLQWLKFIHDNNKYLIGNLHGLYIPGPKTDNDFRIEQSKKIKAFFDATEGKKILTGDFNLLPDTQSLSILEEGMVNLIKTHNITNTRSSHYTKTDQKFADYMLVSPDITVTNFEVPNIEISDHLPMIAELS